MYIERNNVTLSHNMYAFDTILLEENAFIAIYYSR